jgi:DNA-3-methyladenine glycosylase II
MLTTNHLHVTTGTLAPRPPFDFTKTLAFLDDFTPTAGEQALAPASITKALTLNGRAIAFEIHTAGTLKEPSIAYTLYSENPLSEIEHSAITDRMRFFLSLDDDLEPFYAIGRTDPAFAPVIEHLYGLHQPKFLTPFELACWAILAQRNPLAIAHRTKMALVERWGTSITLPDKTYWAFPEPSQLALISPDELAEIVHNPRKVDYLISVIKFFNDVDEQFLRTGNYDEVVAQIRTIRGFGEWSSRFLLIRGLGRVEQVSPADKELSKAAAHVYNQGHLLSPPEMQQILNRYGATQGYWAFYARNAPHPSDERG